MEPLTLLIRGTLMPHQASDRLAQACGNAVGIGLARKGLAPLDESCDEVAAAIEAHARRGQAVILVCVSQGGIAGVSFAHHHPRRKVLRVITLCTPHGGTRLAKRGRRIPAFRDMAMGSQFMLRYQGELPAIAPLIDSVFILPDDIVRPATSCYVEGAENYVYASDEDARRLSPTRPGAWLPQTHANHLTAPFDAIICAQIHDLHEQALLVAA